MANPRPFQWVWLQPLDGAGATSVTSKDAIGETLVVTLLEGGSSNLVNAANS